MKKQQQKYKIALENFGIDKNKFTFLFRVFFVVIFLLPLIQVEMWGKIQLSWITMLYC